VIPGADLADVGRLEIGDRPARLGHDRVITTTNGAVEHPRRARPAHRLIQAGQQRGEIPADVDPDTAIDLIYGPLYRDAHLTAIAPPAQALSCRASALSSKLSQCATTKSPAMRNS
jgi:hypothetical protein